MEANEHLRIERRDDYTWIRIDRADKANALTVSMMEGASAALAQAAADDAVRAVFFTGTGDRVFCAGADVRAKPPDGDMAAHRKRRGGALFELLNAVMDFPKPLIAVLNGVASGGGAMIALVSDARVATDSAALALPEIDLGMPTFTGASIAIVVGGLALATDLVQTGRRMPASEALTRGLVSRVAARAGLEAAAMQVGSDLAAKNAHAFAENKRWLNRAMKAELAHAKAEADAHRKRTA